ncbi:MAG: DNA gyrase inhibitor YacG, partial [Planctomycetota bacterium]|nr:DNA gyrase inhibitor YacG [Planctomycetota bacterium]
RCQKIDLGRWLDEGYGLPIEGQEDFEGPSDAREEA